MEILDQTGLFGGIKSSPENKEMFISELKRGALLRKLIFKSKQLV
jgi:hypothetical protein